MNRADRPPSILPPGCWSPPPPVRILAPSFGDRVGPNFSGDFYVDAPFTSAFVTPPEASASTAVRTSRILLPLLKPTAATPDATWVGVMKARRFPKVRVLRPPMSVRAKTPSGLVRRNAQTARVQETRPNDAAKAHPNCQSEQNDGRFSDGLELRNTSRRGRNDSGSKSNV